MQYVLYLISSALFIWITSIHNYGTQKMLVDFGYVMSMQMTGLIYIVIVAAIFSSIFEKQNQKFIFIVTALFFSGFLLRF